MRAIIAFVFFVQITCLHGQTNFSAIEDNIIDSYVILKEAHKNQNPERQVIFAQKMKKQILFVLLQQGSYYYPFHRLKNYIHIVESKDKKVRVFSWDAMAGGSCRKMLSLAQFRGVRNEPYIQILSDGKSLDYRNSCMHSIYEIGGSDNTLYYMMIGYGSLGAGQQHRTIRMFYLTHNELKECENCFESNSKYWVIQSPLSHKIDLKYNYRRKRLSYKEPFYDVQKGRYTDLNHKNYKQLFWIENKFRN